MKRTSRHLTWLCGIAALLVGWGCQEPLPTATPEPAGSSASAPPSTEPSADSPQAGRLKESGPNPHSGPQRPADTGTETVSAASVPMPGQAAAPRQPVADKASKTHSTDTDVDGDAGIQTVSLRPTAGGYMLDYRYRVMDARKATQWLSAAPPPYLELPETGERLVVPASPKIGPLRQRVRPGAQLREGRQQFVLFANPGQRIKTGQVVRVVLSDTFQELVRVQ